MQPVNRDVSPTSYDPKIDYTRSSQMFQGEVRFGKSTVERTIKWDSDAEMQDIKRDTKMKMLKKHQLAGGKLRQSQSTSPQAYFKQKMML